MLFFPQYATITLRKEVLTLDDIKKKEFLTDFGKRVRQARIEHDMTLEDLANRLGYTTDNARSTVQKIEAGKSDLGASKTYALAKILGVSVEYLMGMEESDTHEEKQACELFEKCYGTEVFHAVTTYMKLDHDDRVKIVERMECLLEDKKYSTQEWSGSG